MNAKVGSFSAPAATGNQSITGVGFQPKALILFGTRATTGDTFTLHESLGIGFSVSSSQRRTISVTSTSSASPSVSGKREAALAITIASGLGTASAEADLVSMDSDGFTLNWTTAGTQYLIGYLALGGSDLTNAFVGDYVTGTGTGNKSVTGVGFKPDLILVLGSNTANALPVAATFGMTNLGAADSGLRSRSVSFDVNHNVNPTATSQWMEGSLTSSPQPGGTVIESESQIVSMDTDGFTYSISTNSNDRYMFLALKGGNYFVGGDTQKTSTGTKATTGVGFKPAALLLMGNNFVNTGSINNSVEPPCATMVVGVTDGTNETSCWVNDRDALVTSDVHCFTSTTKTIKHAHESPSQTIEAEADISSMDSDGFTLNWTTADSSARDFYFIAFGPGPSTDTGLAWITA